MDEIYTNRGKGVVLPPTAEQQQAVLSRLLEGEATNAELNSLVGWQFSQAIYALRGAGHNIQTLGTGRRGCFKSRLEPGTYTPKRRREPTDRNYIVSTAVKVAVNRGMSPEASLAIGTKVADRFEAVGSPSWVEFATELVIDIMKETGR